MASKKCDAIVANSDTKKGHVRTKTIAEAKSRLDQILSNERNLRKAAIQVFNHFDNDNNGKLSIEELKKLFRTLEAALMLPFTKEETIYKLLSKFNYDVDGAQLSKDEFVILYRNTLLHARASLTDPTNESSIKIERDFLVGHQFLTGSKGHRIEDKFIFKKKLGSGTFGDAYYAIDKDNQLPRCIKSVDKTRMDLPKDQYKAEIDVMKALDHPNIVKMYDVYEDSNNVYLIMEYCAGGEVFTFIKAQNQGHKKLSERYMARIMKQILQGIHYCHRRNIVHKDLKPQNIMLSDETFQDIKVIDFGVAEVFTSRDSSSRISAGTALYMAPEALRSNVTLKSDIWSLGCVLYNLVAGKYPFWGNSVSNLKQQIFEHDPPIEKDFKDVSEDCRDLIQKMLRKRPSERFSAEECLAHPWFENAPDDPIRMCDDVLDRLKKFSHRTKLNAALSNVVAHQLNVNNKEVKRAIRIFKSMDADNDGELGLVELSAGLIKSGWGRSEIDKLIDVLDADGSGTICISEFVAACQTWTENELGILYSAFQRLDKDGDGRVSVEEFAQIAVANGRMGSKHDIKQLLKEIDTDGNGVIDWYEFKHFFLQKENS